MAVRPPTLAVAPATYNDGFMASVLNELRLYFERTQRAYPHVASTLNININTLPTQTSLATLRSGDVYRDTTAGHVLKIKP